MKNLKIKFKIYPVKLNFYFTGIIFLIIIFFSILRLAENSQAAVDLPWSTTFDCNEWQEDFILPEHQYTGNWPPADCPDITIGLWGVPNQTQITTPANFANGSGNRGMRFWKGDGSNIDSSIARIYFSTGQTEFWVRWYMRYEAGFAWNPYIYDKLIYLYYADTGMGGISATSINSINIWNNAPSTTYNGSEGFYESWGGNSAVSDGSWHCIEAHFKMDTDGTDGEGNLWIDGSSILSATNINWSNGDATFRSAGWGSFMFDHNQSTVANGESSYVDWDDMAISNTGYIGPIEPSDTTPPSAPSGLSVS